MPLDATHLEYTSPESHDGNNRADLVYTMTAADLLAAQTHVERVVDSIVQPITTPEQVAEILAHPEYVHCIVIAGASTMTLRQMQA